MHYKGKRYKVDETKLKENKKNLIIFLTIVTIITAGITSILLFISWHTTQTNEISDNDYIDYTTNPVTEPIEFYSTVPSTNISESPTNIVEKPIQETTQASTVETTEESIEESTEEQETKTWLVDIDNPDYDYEPQAIFLTDDDRELIATVVMHEFGAGGYIACCIQAQAFRDAMIFGQASAQSTYHFFQYDTYPLTQTPNQDCYDAVDYIFAGNMAVPHRILVMYTPQYVVSDWHESQTFVLEYGGVRYFDMG